MSTAELHPDTAGLLCEQEREQVRAQLQRILDTHHFKNSRRYPALLRFIVEETLEGRGDQLKERLLGVHVFDRPADYDTASDPIVRVTIAEIRKRIAQYYHHEEHDAEIRIELMPGRYAPEFRARREIAGAREEQGAQPAGFADRAPSTPLEEIAEAPLAVAAPPQARARSLWQGWHGQRLWLLAAAALALATAVLLGVRWLQVSALEQFWMPVLAPGQTVLLCLPTPVNNNAPLPVVQPGSSTSSSSPGTSTSFLDYEARGENVVFSDVNALLSVVNVLVAYHREYRVKLYLATTLDDLRRGPTVLIGGLDNPWTMRTLNKLPIHFDGSDEAGFWITRPDKPGNRDWSLDLKQQYASVTRDYAIVARIRNEQTGEPEVILAGIGMSGTAAAGEFAGSDERMRELRQRLGSDWKTHDFEVVLSTDVVNGIAGSPRIEFVKVL